MTTATLEDIRAAAQNLANRRNDTLGCSTLLNAEIKAAIAPVLECYKLTLDQYAAAESSAMAELDKLLASNPHLFVKPRSMTVDGVRCGYKKEPDGLDWTSDDDVIKAIKALLPELAPILVRTEERLNREALPAVAPEHLQKVGIRQVVGADQRFITLGENDVERMSKMIITDASKRQGEDEAAPKARSKAKTKVAEVA